MAAELELMQAIDMVRKQLHLSQEQLATRMGKKREAVSRLLSADDINPTLNTLIELLSALNLTADITLRQAREGEGPIKVATDLPETQCCAYLINHPLFRFQTNKHHPDPQHPTAKTDDSTALYHTL